MKKTFIIAAIACFLFSVTAVGYTQLEEEVAINIQRTYPAFVMDFAPNLFKIEILNSDVDTKQCTVSATYEYTGPGTITVWVKPATLTSSSAWGNLVTNMGVKWQGSGFNGWDGTVIKLGDASYYQIASITCPVSPPFTESGNILIESSVYNDVMLGFPDTIVGGVTFKSLQE